MHSALAVNPSVAAYLITVQVASHLGNYVLGTRHSFWDNEMFPEMHRRIKFFSSDARAASDATDASTTHVVEGRT